MEIPRGRGFQTPHFFKGKYGTNMEFPKGFGGGGGVQAKKPSMGEVSGTTHSMGQCANNAKQLIFR